MAETQETIADIIAEKRRRADEIERDCAERMRRGEIVSDRYARELVADIRREADRLEAAHKRELSKNGADFGQLGDAAKLREALVQAELFVSNNKQSLALLCHKELVQLVLELVKHTLNMLHQ